MTDFPSAVPTPSHIHSWTSFFANGAVGTIGASGGIAGAVAWPAANLALYQPFSLPFPYSIKRLMIGRGTGGLGNWSLGIYDKEGASIYLSGGFAASGGTTQIQYHTVTTPFTLDPGEYFFGVSSDTTASKGLGENLGATRTPLFGAYEEAAAYPLPSTATFTVSTQSLWQWCGFARI
jgi:hypothetical protein